MKKLEERGGWRKPKKKNIWKSTLTSERYETNERKIGGKKEEAKNREQHRKPWLPNQKCCQLSFAQTEKTRNDGTAVGKPQQPRKEGFGFEGRRRGEDSGIVAS